MKIIKMKEDDVVVFAEDNLSLTETGASGDGWIASFVTSDNADLIDVPALPDNFIGGMWTYTGEFIALPCLADCVAANAAKEAARYAEKRAVEYPPIGDQLDAIWKMIDSLRSAGTILPVDTADELNKVLLVKQKYPKPNI